MSDFAFHPEDKARSLIDRQLGASGWLIQSKEEMNLGAGPGVAVRELQTASGPVDYALFVHPRLCGVIKESLEPLPSVVAGRFNLWLGREEKAGRDYSEEQKAWLVAIRDHLAVNIEIRPEDMMDAPEFSARGGIVRARALFGARLPGLLEELTDTLVA